MNQRVQGQVSRLPNIVARLVNLPAETMWVEFKENYFYPEKIGEYASALSNGAALNHQERGYLLWGVRDSDHLIVGTSVDPLREKKGNEDFLAWLNRSLRPEVHIAFHKFEMHGKNLVLMEVSAPHSQPVRFDDHAYIRVGSYTKKLRDHVDHERRLWQVFNQTSFEDNIAMSSVDGQDVVDLIDYPSYFRLLKRPLPNGLHGILDGLAKDDIIRSSENSADWDVTNLGAMLFASDISDFPSLSRKALRIIQYKGENRIETAREQGGVYGYATGFAGAVQWLINLLPASEILGDALREEMPMYPTLAVRELLANALIHQDFSQRGNGPMIEVFERRIEITSPGEPLVDPLRFVDAPPKSRNEKLAAVMRRAGYAEERGSGWDKIAFQAELYQLPAPLVSTPGENTKVTLYAPKPFAEMNKAERIGAVYLHAVLRYVSDAQLTNASLRERFKLKDGAAGQVSRLISDAVDERWIVPVDPSAGRRFMRYVPWWAAPDDPDG